MGADHSQPSQAVAQLDVANTKPFDPDEITSSSDDEINSVFTANMNQSSEPLESPSESRLKKRKAKRREKRKKSQRRPSLEESSLAPESEGGDLSSIPYRADEQAERAALVADTVTEYGVKNTNATRADSLKLASNHALSDSISNDGILGNMDGDEQNEISSTQSTKLPAMIVHRGTDGKYPCPQASLYGCDKTFTMLSSAQRHTENVHLGQKYTCSVCAKEFGRKDKFTRHKLTHSKKEFKAASQHLDAQGAHTLTTSTNMHRTHGNAEGVDSEGNVDMHDAEQQAPQSSLQAVPDTILRPDHRETGVTIPDEQTAENDTSSSTRDLDGPISPQTSENINPTSVSTKSTKRKRDGSDHVESDTTRKARKRGRSGRTPSASAISQSVYSVRNDKINGTATPMATQTKSKVLGVGSLDNFAKPWKPGSQLYHPTLNPRSPQAQSSSIEVIIPRSTKASSSSSKLSAQLQQVARHEANGSLQTPAGNRKRKAEYTSNKGKGRAELDTEYSSPLRKEIHTRKGGIGVDIVANEADNNDHEEEDEGEGDVSEDDDQDNLESDTNADQSGMATSVARKTSTKQQKIRSRRTGASALAAPESDSDIPASPSGDIYVCQECRRKFSSRRALRRHEDRPGGHTTQVKCEDCNQLFVSQKMLQQHERETEHGDGTGLTGRKGNFSNAEVDKLFRWRNNFCAEYDLTHIEFNSIMTDTCRRSKGFIWPYRFITKSDFLQQYYDVLPNRNRRSLHRYRERAFQNVPSNQQWTQDDDKELAELVAEIGPKWVEIGQRMSRTQDSVCQRWRHKVQYRGKQHDGEWSSKETSKLVDAVNAVKRESGISFDPNSDVKMPWEIVSKKLKGVRSAQQCSNKWRLMNVSRIKGVFVKSSDADFRSSASSTPLPGITPSKMTQRLAGELSASPIAKRAPRVYTSEKYVRESDEDSLDANEPDKMSQNEEASQEERTMDDRPPEVFDDQKSRLTPDTSNGDTAAHTTGDGDTATTVAAPVVSDDEELEQDEDAENGTQRPPATEDMARSENSGAAGEIALSLQVAADSNDAVAEGGQNSVSSTSGNMQAHDRAHDRGSNDLQVYTSEQSASDDNSNASHEITTNPFPTTTPQNRITLSQAFNQTQANTSAVRAPKSSEQLASRPDRPSPNIVMRTRPSSDIIPDIAPGDDGSSEEDTSSSGTDSESSSASSSLSTNASNHALRFVRSLTSILTKPDVEPESGSESESESDSESSSESESSSDASDDDKMVEDTRKESFLQSLRQHPQQPQGQTNEHVSSNASQRSKRVDWHRALQGHAQAIEEESSSDGDE